MKNITDLRNSLLSDYSAMKNNEMDLKKGKELANCAGKIISSLKVELEYNKLLGVKKEIDFLKSPK